MFILYRLEIITFLSHPKKKLRMPGPAAAPWKYLTPCPPVCLQTFRIRGLLFGAKDKRDILGMRRQWSDLLAYWGRFKGARRR